MNVGKAAHGLERTFLVGNGGRLIGVVTQKQLQEAVNKGGKEKCVGDLIRSPGRIDFPHVHSDHALDVALERMGTYGSTSCR